MQTTTRNKTQISEHNDIHPSQEVVCALCGPDVPFRVKFAEHLPSADVGFSARRAPSKVHYRLVECEGCGLVFSNPIYQESHILEQYFDAEYFQEEQTSNYLVAYTEEFLKTLKMAGKIDSLLEVGCADGYFLRVAKDMGIPKVCGVEPGSDAVNKADADLRPFICNGAFHEGLYEDNSFDMVCIFQVLDHVVDPIDIMTNVARVLKPGGYFLTITHNVKSWQPRLIGESCPMFDVQHIFLWDLHTIRKLMEKVGLSYVRGSNIRVQYGVSFFIRMLPLPMRLRLWMMKIVERFGLGKISFRLGGGNMVAVGRKPE